MIRIELSTDNAAFDDDAGTEAARILRELADGFDSGMEECTTHPLRDVNGNTVGSVWIDRGTL